MESSENCPFCCAPLDEGAVVCRHCGRDVAFVAIRTLMRRLAEAERRIEAQETRLAVLQEAVPASLPAPEAIPEAAPQAEVSALNGSVAEGVPFVWSSLGWLVLLVALLLAAHALIVGAFDLDTRVLRVVSVLLPLPFGLLRPLPSKAAVFAGLGVGALAACGMLETTSLLDHDSFLPTDRHDWVEVAQYVACIAFAYFGGSLVGGRRQQGRHILPLGRSFVVALIHGGTPPAQRGQLSTVQHVHATAAWINSVMVVMSAIGAIVTALGQLGQYLP